MDERMAERWINVGEVFPWARGVYFLFIVVS